MARGGSPGGAPIQSIKCNDGVAVVRRFDAVPPSATQGRAFVKMFLREQSVRQEVIDEVILAAGEALANSIEHAYPAGTIGDVAISVYCCLDHDSVVVEVRDKGKMQDGVAPKRGFGFVIMRALAEVLTIDTSHGTAVTLAFRA